MGMLVLTPAIRAPKRLRTDDAEHLCMVRPGSQASNREWWPLPPRQGQPNSFLIWKR